MLHMLIRKNCKTTAEIKKSISIVNFTFILNFKAYVIFSFLKVDCVCDCDR